MTEQLHMTILTISLATAWLLLFGLSIVRPATALLAALVAAAALETVTLQLGAHVGICFGLSLAMFILPTIMVRQVLADPSMGRPAFPKVVWILIILAAVTFTTWALQFMGVVLQVVFVAILLYMAYVNRRARDRQVLLALASAVRQDLPLSEAMAAHAPGLPGKAADIALRMSGRLGVGVSVYRAVCESFKGCPGYATGLIGAAEPAGRLREAMACLENELLHDRRTSAMVGPGMVLYPLGVFALLCLVGGLLLVSVVPKYLHLMVELELPLAWPTRVLADTSRFMTDYMVLFLLAIAVTLVALVVWLVALFSSRRPNSPGLLMQLRDHVLWRVPLLGRIELHRSMEHLTRALRLAVDGGVPMLRAAELASRTDINCAMRRRVYRWMERLSMGEPPDSAVRKAGLPTPLAWAVAHNDRRQIVDGLQALEVMYQSRRHYGASLVRSVVWPVSILAMGLVVALFAMGIMMPLLSIINYQLNNLVPN